MCILLTLKVAPRCFYLNLHQTLCWRYEDTVTSVWESSFTCPRGYQITYQGHFTVIEPSKFQNKTMKSSNINALFCHTNTKMPENYNFQILVTVILS